MAQALDKKIVSPGCRNPAPRRKEPRLPEKSTAPPGETLPESRRKTFFSGRKKSGYRRKIYGVPEKTKFCPAGSNQIAALPINFPINTGYKIIGFDDTLAPYKPVPCWLPPSLLFYALQYDTFYKPQAFND